MDYVLTHHGILGMKWGVRRYQNPDGTLTPAGRKRYGVSSLGLEYSPNKKIRKAQKKWDEKFEKNYSNNFVKFHNEGVDYVRETFLDKFNKTDFSSLDFSIADKTRNLNDIKGPNELVKAYINGVEKSERLLNEYRNKKFKELIETRPK